MREVGRSIKKIDGFGIATGSPAYTDDLVKDALVVKILRSPYAFAKIRNIDVKKALELDGVECILTYKDFPRIRITRAGQGYPEPSPYDKYVLDEYVRYVGDEVAVVAAKDEKTAQMALDLIEVDYEVFEPVLDFEKSMDHHSVIHPEGADGAYDPSRNLAAHFEMKVGDVDKILKECDVVVKERFYTQAQAHVMMEPHTAAAYIDYTGRLVVISSTQVPFHIRRILARLLKKSIKDIRVIKPRIGGGFGGKQAVHGEPYVAMVTLKTGKPSKIIYTRKEVFESTYTRHPMRIDVTLGATKDGKLRAIDMEVLSDTGAYGEHALTVLMVTGSKSLPLYNKVDALRFKGDVVYTNHPPAGAYRGYGAVQGNFALESAMDILAEKLNIDPIELRMKNMIREGETSPVFKIMGEGREGVEMTIKSCKLEECLKRGRELIRWEEKRNKDKKMEDGSKVRGVGVAIAMQGSGIAKIDMGSATLKLNDDGSFNLLIGATDLGTGSDTILSQIAAEALGVSVEKIIPYSSDTDLTPFDKGAYASSTTYVSGNAVKKAAEKMRELIKIEGAKKLGVDANEVRFDGEKILTKDGRKKIKLDELATILYYTENQKQLCVTESFVGDESPPPYMAGFAEVEVDKETGKINLVKYVAVVDCGVPINPNLARIQMEGGLVQGIGMTLFEDVKYSKDGKLLTNNMMDYKIPSRMDIGEILVEFVDSFEPTGPFGAKSVAEVGIDTPPAAIANALYNALGIRFTRLPIKPQDVLKALESVKA